MAIENEFFRTVGFYYIPAETTTIGTFLFFLILLSILSINLKTFRIILDV
jgi:hypothetical protein